VPIGRLLYGFTIHYRANLNPPLCFLAHACLSRLGGRGERSILPASKAQMLLSASIPATIIGAFGFKSNTFARRPDAGRHSGERTERRLTTMSRSSYRSGRHWQAGQEGAYRTAIGRDEVERYGYQTIVAWCDVLQGEILQEQNIGP
jgi:hypothetical protein